MTNTALANLESPPEPPEPIQLTVVQAAPAARGTELAEKEIIGITRRVAQRWCKTDTQTKYLTERESPEDPVDDGICRGSDQWEDFVQEARIIHLKALPQAQLAQDPRSYLATSIYNGLKSYALKAYGKKQESRDTRNDRQGDPNSAPTEAVVLLSSEITISGQGAESADTDGDYSIEATVPLEGQGQIRTPSLYEYDAIAHVAQKIRHEAEDAFLAWAIPQLRPDQQLALLGNALGHTDAALTEAYRRDLGRSVSKPTIGNHRASAITALKSMRERWNDRASRAVYGAERSRISWKYMLDVERERKAIIEDPDEPCTPLGTPLRILRHDYRPR